MMKLSEAIREGCKYGPQAFGYGIVGDSLCALGGAVKVVGDDPRRWVNVLDHWPISKTHQAKCPKCENTDILCGIIFHLNDDHRMSREAISEFVECEERKLGLWDTPAPDSPVVVEAVKASLEPVKT